MSRPGGPSLTPSPEHSPPDVARMVEVLDRNGVEYLVVGGVATQVYGAERPTGDFDCLVRRTRENFERLATAMRELNARLRVQRMTDDEAAQLPTQVHAETIARMEISTLANGRRKPRRAHRYPEPPRPPHALRGSGRCGHES
jgi:hypothetical protein